MPSGTPVGMTRTFNYCAGAQFVVGIGMVSGTISPLPIILGRVIISAPGSRAKAIQIFRFR